MNSSSFSRFSRNRKYTYTYITLVWMNENNVNCGKALPKGCFIQTSVQNTVRNTYPSVK